MPKTRVWVFKQQISGNVCETRVSPVSEPPFQADQTEEMSGPLVDHSKWPIILPCFEVKGSLLNCQKDIERQYLRSFAHRKKKKNIVSYLFQVPKAVFHAWSPALPKPKMWPFFPRPSAECSWWLKLRDRVSKTHEAGSLAKQCRLLKEPLEWPSIFRLVICARCMFRTNKNYHWCSSKEWTAEHHKKNKKTKYCISTKTSLCLVVIASREPSLTKKTSPHCLVIYRARATMQKEVGFQDTWRSAIRMCSFTTWLCLPLSITHGVDHHVLHKLPH